MLTGRGDSGSFARPKRRRHIARSNSHNSPARATNCHTLGGELRRSGDGLQPAADPERCVAQNGKRGKEQRSSISLEPAHAEECTIDGIVRGM
jgi:hypothetical protein